MKQDSEDQSLLEFCALCALHQVYLSPDTVRAECGISYGTVDWQDILRAAEVLFLNPKVLPSTKKGQPELNTFPLLAINVKDHSSFVLANQQDSVKIFDAQGQIMDWPLHRVLPSSGHEQFQFLSLSPNTVQIKRHFSSRVQLMGNTIPLSIGGWVQILLECIVLVIGLQWVRFLVKVELSAYNNPWAIFLITLMIGLSCFLLIWGWRKLASESWEVYNRKDNQLHPPIISSNVFRNWAGINGFLWLVVLVSYTIWYTPLTGGILLSLSLITILIISLRKRKNQGLFYQSRDASSGTTPSNHNVQWYHWLLISGAGSMVLGIVSVFFENPMEYILLHSIIGGLAAIAIWQIPEWITYRKRAGLYIVPDKEDANGISNIENWTSGNLIYKDKKTDQTIFNIPHSKATICYGNDKRKMELFLDILLAKKTEPFCCVYVNDLAITPTNREIYQRNVLVTNPRYSNHVPSVQDTLASDTKSEVRRRIFSGGVDLKLDSSVQSTILEALKANPSISVIDNLSDHLDPFHEMILLENIIDFRDGQTTLIFCNRPELMSLGHFHLDVDALPFKNLQS